MAERGKRLAQGVQGVEIGAGLLVALARADGPMALGELASACNLPPSKTHRYLVSLCRSGLVEQDSRNGRYDLGPTALTVGLAAQYRLDEMRLADQAVGQLHEDTHLTVGLAVWGDHGATVVRRREGQHAVTVSRRIGSTMPLLTTNSGRVFAAYLPTETTKPIIDAEFAAALVPVHMGKPLTRAAYERLLGQVRRQGWSSTRGDSLAGLDALAMPVFDHEHTICMTLSVMGAHGAVDLTPAGKAFAQLRRAAGWLSARLGYVAPRGPAVD